MINRLQVFLATALLPLLWFAPIAPALAQTTQTAPAPAPLLGFVPTQQATIPAGILTFTLDPSIANMPGQVAALQAQVAALNGQNSVLNSQVAAAAPTFYGQPIVNRYSDSSPGGPHLAFAHFLPTAGDYGKTQDWSLPGYPNCPSVQQDTQDINEAAAIGFDGFGIDFGSASDPSITAAGDKIFSAADVWVPTPAALNMGVNKFTPFLQFDFSTYPESIPLVVAEINRCIQHPSYYRYHGLPFVSTYAGEGGTYTGVKAFFGGVEAALAAQNPPVHICFVPFFNLRSPDGSVPSVAPPAAAQQEVTGLLSGLAQGAWLAGEGLGDPLGPSSGLPASELYAAALRTAGLDNMASVSWGYSGLAHAAPGRFWNEHDGGEGDAAQWNSIFYSQKPKWVEFFTWNDWDEGSALSNANVGPTGPWPYFAHSGQADFYKSKLGVQARTRLFLQQYKTGQVPGVTNDNLWADYRTQPAAMVATSDPLGPLSGFSTDDGSQNVQDVIYITTDTVATETLTVTNGPVTTTRTVPPGLFFSRVPFVAGPVSFTLKAIGTGQTLVSLTGEPVVSSAALYDWLPWTGWAHD